MPMAPNGPLQSYQGRALKKRPGLSSDAKMISPDMYGHDPGDDPETEPTGLVDRLAHEQLEGQPVDDPQDIGDGVLDENGRPIKKLSSFNRLPTTKRAY